MRNVQAFSLFLAGAVLAVGLVLVHAAHRTEADKVVLNERREMVRRLELTDLCLFTDARYTRHPGMADLNTPFQDHPMSFEHFPSGSLMSVSPHLSSRDGGR